MMIKRFSLLFRLEKRGNYKLGDKMPVYMRITVNSTDNDDSDRTELSCNRQFGPIRWNKKAGRATGIKEDTKSPNAYLDSLQITVHEAYRELLEAN